MTEWNIRPGEMEEEYIYRLGLAKEQIGSWQDVADILNTNLGHEYTESKYRKQFQTFQRMLSANRKNIESGAFMDELDEKTAEYEKAAQKYRDQRNAYASYIRTDARWENLTNILSGAIRELDSLRSLKRTNMVQASGEDELIVVLSDWHYGMKTENIWNQYNKDIFVNRASNLLDEVKSIASAVHPEKIRIVILGDMCHGAIHTSARVESEEMVSVQLIQVSEYLARFISSLANFACYTQVYCTYGNHMRVVQNKKDSLHRDNFERIIPWWLETRFADRDDILVVNDPDAYEFIRLSACGKNFCASHGDLDCVKGSGKVLNTLFTKRFGEGIDYLILGDKHHIDVFSDTGIRAVGVGSLCGTDDHGNSGRLYDTPSQTVFHLRPGRGVYATYDIELYD